MRAFAAYDSEGNGFIAADKLESLVSSLPELRAPPLPELRKQHRRLTARPALLEGGASVCRGRRSPPQVAPTLERPSACGRGSSPPEAAPKMGGGSACFPHQAA